MALTKVRSGMRTLATDEVVADNIAAGAVGASEIADGTVVAADLAADSVTASEIAAGAVSASEIASTFDISSKTVTLPAAAVTAHVTAFDDSVLSNNVALLAFKLAAGDSLTKFNMVDSVIDDFKDLTGCDTGSSTNESVKSGYLFGGISDANCIMLMQSQSQTNLSTTFVDRSQYEHTVTAGGSPVHSTTQAKFGSSSIQFAVIGNDNDRLIYPVHSSTAFGTGDFTVEAWIYISEEENGYNTIVSNFRDDESTTGWSLPSPRRLPMPIITASSGSSRMNISTTGPATASPAGTGSSSASRKG